MEALTEMALQILANFIKDANSFVMTLSPGLELTTATLLSREAD